MRTLTAEERDLITVLYAPLRRFAAAVRPAEVDVDDLLHDALARALVRTELSSLGDPGAYLRRAIVTTAANHRRGLGRLRRARVRLAGGLGGGEADHYPSDVAELLRLPPVARAVVYLTAVEGRSYAEVADLVGCSEVAARKTASRARRRLAGQLAAERSR